MQNEEAKTELDTNFLKFAPIYFLYDRDIEKSARISVVLREKFLGNKPITEENLSGLINVRVFFVFCIFFLANLFNSFLVTV